MAFCDRIEYYIIVKRELAEWFIAISLKLILVKSTNIRSNRIFSDDNTILLRRPTKAKKPTFAQKILKHNDGKKKL